MKTVTQKINGVEYVYQDQPYWDKEKKRGTHRRTYIGKNVNGEFVPNKTYTLQKEMENSEKAKPGPVPVDACQRTFYGATYLFDKIGEITGVTEDLKNSFPQDYKEILSLAYYLALENQSPLYRFHKWSFSHEHPCGHDIASQRSSEIFSHISEAQKMDFFKRQAKRRLETEYLAYDTTSISSYSQSLKQVQYGVNKEQDPLPQINLALLYGETSRLPAYYRKLPGNIADVKTVSNLLRDINFLQMDKVKFVMDRGFYSEANINELFRKHYKFLISSKMSLKFVKAKVDECREEFCNRTNYDSVTKLYIRSFTTEWDYSETKPRSGEVIKEKRRIYLHVYYNDQHAADDRARLNALLDILEAELRSDSRNPEHEKAYEKYFMISSTPVRGIQIEPNQSAIDKSMKDCGFFTLFTNEIKDPIESLCIYRSKDLVEKAFGNLKERLNMRRMSVASEENLEGKLFVQFVALIFLSYVKKAMDEHKLFSSYTMQELFDDLDFIECFEKPDHHFYFGEITKKQQTIFSAMNVPLPS